jgi:hypothetical protein
MVKSGLNFWISPGETRYESHKTKVKVRKKWEMKFSVIKIKYYFNILFKYQRNLRL